MTADNNKRPSRDLPSETQLPNDFRALIAGVRELFREAKKFVIFVRHRENSNASLVILTFAIAIAALVQAIVNIWQLPLIRKSADAARVAAEIAQKSFEMDRRRAEDTEEATCRPTGDIAVGATAYRFSVTNSGKVSARNLHGHFQISLNTVRGNQQIRKLAEFDVSQDELAGAQPIQKFVGLDIVSDWDNLVSTKETLAAIGEIQYENGFGRIRSSPMCYVMVWIPSSNDPNNRAHGYGLDCDGLAQWLDTNLPKSKLTNHE